MAVQYQFAFSSETVGAGVFAGGPYMCALGEADPLACAWLPDLIALPVLEEEAKVLADAGSIDELAYLENHHVYLFSGKNDKAVLTGVLRKLEQMYKDLGVRNIATEYNTEAGHSWPTNDYGNPCGTTEPPFITNCNYDGAGEALQAIYGKLKPPVAPKPSNIKTMRINQFVPNAVDPSYISMNNTLVYYEPEACRGNCTIHLALTGCLSTYEEVGTLWVQYSGFNKWAEANNMVILYPYLINSIVDPINPMGCWDWWGYTKITKFATKAGPQMATLNNIVKYFEKAH